MLYGRINLIFLNTILNTMHKIGSHTYPCPTCKTLTIWQDNPTKPFCSKRCQLIDLGEWASENYKIASLDTPFSDEINTLNDNQLD